MREEVMGWLQEVKLRVLRLAVGDAGEEGAAVTRDILRRQLDHVEVERHRADRLDANVQRLRRLDRRDRRRLCRSRSGRGGGHDGGAGARGGSGGRRAAELDDLCAIIGIEGVVWLQEGELGVAAARS